MSVLTQGAARATIVAVAAAGALALVALPSAAHAAEVVTCTQAATAETQPWLTFVEDGNLYEPLSVAIDTWVGATQNLPASLPVAFTEADLAAYSEQRAAAEAALEASAGAGVGDPLAALGEQLEAVDPENTTGWQEKLDALRAEFQSELNELAPTAIGAFSGYTNALTDFADAANDAVQADNPEGGPYARPELPTNLASDGAIIIGLYDAVSDLYQSIFLDAAASNVVYVETCVTTTVPDAAVAVAPAAPAAPATLAATGTSDGIAIGTASGLLLLVGAAALVLVRRRHSA